MKKRMISIIMVFILAAAVAVPALAAGYTDLNGHWAKEYMLDLAEKGYMTGYDNAMRPDAKITAAETLVLLSRFYKPSEAENALIQSDYQTIVSGNVSPSYTWAYKELAICLAAGIVTESELVSMNLGTEMKKEQLSFYLIRTLQLTSEADALSNAALTFTDAAQISSSCRGSVAKLVALKIVGGNDTGQFLPQSPVTRATAATMVSRALDYLEENNKSLVVEAYSGLSRLEGIIEAVGAARLDIRTFDGLVREYAVPASAQIIVNGTAKALNTVYVGCSAVVSVQNGAVSKIAVSQDTDTVWVQGAVNAVSFTTASNNLYVKNLSTGTVTPYNVPSVATCAREGTSIAPTGIKNTDFITLKIVKGVVTRADVTTGSRELTGVISEITYGSTVTFKMTDATGVKYKFLLNIAHLPQILRGSTAISIDRLKTGGSVTVIIERCEIATIVSTGTETTLTGELTSISTTKSGTVWVVTPDGGAAVTLTLDENASVYSGAKAILLSDIKVGDKVTVVVYNNTITEINLNSAVSSSDKVSGGVLAVDATSKVITILTPNGKLVYINISAVLSIISSATGRSVTLSAITTDSQIVAYGAYSDSTHFSANSIIIE
jgi:hypothetical protein